MLPVSERKYKVVDMITDDKSDHDFDLIDKEQDSKNENLTFYLVTNFMIQLTYCGAEESKDNNSSIVPEQKLFKSLGHGISSFNRHVV